jgi:signal transduction protein with GAF and PtsI domain
MDNESKLRAMLDLAEAMGIGIRRAPADVDGSDHPGGALVRVGKRELLFLDPSASVEDQLAAAVEALKGRAELQSRYIPPEVRDVLEGEG